jgi:hypothetical protein
MSSTGSTPETFQPRSIDVLSGRGKATYSHPGNQRYLQVIEETLEEYLVTESKLAKSRVVRNIVRTLEKKEGRKFLVKNSKTGDWTELDNKAVMDKVGHSLRDMKATKLGRGGRLAREAHYAALEREINRNRRLHAMLPNLKQPSAAPFVPEGLASLLRPIIRAAPMETLQHPNFGSALRTTMSNDPSFRMDPSFNARFAASGGFGVLSGGMPGVGGGMVGIPGGMGGAGMDPSFTESLLASRRVLMHEQQLIDQSLQRAMAGGQGSMMGMGMGRPSGLDPDLIYSSGLR